MDDKRQARFRPRRSLSASEVLEHFHNISKEGIKIDRGVEIFQRLDNSIVLRLRTLARYSASQKAVVTVLITSLVKKILDPDQDVRLHQSKMRGGYSGRTLDTQNITPFMHTNFRRIAMKESGWLTRSLEQGAPYNLDYPGAIQNRRVKNAFLGLLEDIENNNLDPKSCLVVLFILLEFENEKVKKVIHKMPKNVGHKTVNDIITLLNGHFGFNYKEHGASKLPVIAIYSIYKIMFNELERFKNYTLLSLKSHLSANSKSRGISDIEIVSENGEFYEGIEVKLGIQVDYDMLETIYDKKIKIHEVSRYYVLTSAEQVIKEGEKYKIKQLIETIRNEDGCEVIVNGLIPSISYYLRLLREPNSFIEEYKENLVKEIEESSEIKIGHIEKWIELIGDAERARMWGGLGA